MENKKDVNLIIGYKKVVIPNFTAGWIESSKGWNDYCQDYIEDDSIPLLSAIDLDNCAMPKKVSDWLQINKNDEIFTRAWLDGYEVKKEQLYTVDLGDNSGLYKN